MAEEAEETEEASLGWSSWTSRTRLCSTPGTGTNKDWTG